MMWKTIANYTFSLYVNDLEIFCRIPRLALDVVWATILQDEHHPKDSFLFL